ncbi:hypothetical protein [Streptomyces sp. N35]|uniref:ParB/RepB/Spo0J family partition protein n=1 Tax=Streptomyces sp. N35 TaxID=2795730 RepID=UPI0018F30DB5|nr:hypothetical protein [Streptomyces sp. N35]
MAPRGQFNRRQEGQRFLTPLTSIAPSPRNLREEWEYETDEFDEFKTNIDNTEVIQDPAVSSVEAFIAKYPTHAGSFGADVEWVLLAGERRYRALLATKTPDASVAVVLRDQLLEKGDFVLLSENNFRKGFDVIQEALILKRIRDEEGLTYDQILERLGGEQTRIKKRSDISKRIKLLELDDGPLRRAIRQGDIGLEPAYTLVSQLKEPARIEQGWALMQEQSVLAKAACDILLDRKPTSPGTDSRGSEGGPKSESDKPQTPADSSGSAAEDDASGGEGGDQRAQNGQSSGGDASKSRPKEVPEARRSSDKTGSKPPAAFAALIDERVGACSKLVSSTAPGVVDGVTRSLAVHAIHEAEAAAFVLAAQIAERAGMTVGDKFGYVAALEAADDVDILRVAYAVALASDELHFRSQGDQLDARAVRYLNDLRQGAGYDITGYQPALEAVSSAKL